MKNSSIMRGAGSIKQLFLGRNIGGIEKKEKNSVSESLNHNKISDFSDDVRKIHENEIKNIEKEIVRTEKDIEREKHLKDLDEARALKRKILNEKKYEQMLLISKRKEQRLKETEEECKRRIEIKRAAIEKARSISEERKKTRKLKESSILKKYQDNIYIRGRAAWNDMYGSALDRTRKYRYTCIILASALFISVISLAYMGSQSRIQPYVVEVGQGGNILGVAVPSSSNNLSSKIVQYFIEQFVINLRSITPDNIVEKKNMADVYACVNTAPGSNALRIVKGYIENNNPFVLNSKETNQIQIESIMAISDKTYQINWSETKRTLEGTVISNENYTGQFTYMTGNVTSEGFSYNPFGIYITDISWSKVNTAS